MSINTCFMYLSAPTLGVCRHLQVLYSLVGLVPAPIANSPFPFISQEINTFFLTFRKSMITPQQIIPFADRLQKVLFGYLRLFSVTYPQANIHKYIHSLYRIVLTDLIHIKLLTSMAHINIQTSPCSPT